MCIGEAAPSIGDGRTGPLRRKSGKVRVPTKE